MNFTKQELFDKAYTAIINQGVPSMTGTVCQYRGPNGTSCAIGHLLTPELRKTIPEGGIIAAIRNDKDIASYFGVEDVRDTLPSLQSTIVEFLDQMQRAHDIAASPSVDESAYDTHTLFTVSLSDDFIADFKHHMGQLAAWYKLTVPEV